VRSWAGLERGGPGGRRWSALLLGLLGAALVFWCLHTAAAPSSALTFFSRVSCRGGGGGGNPETPPSPGLPRSGGASPSPLLSPSRPPQPGCLPERGVGVCRRPLPPLRRLAESPGRGQSSHEAPARAPCCASPRATTSTSSRWAARTAQHPAAPRSTTQDNTAPQAGLEESPGAKALSACSPASSASAASAAPSPSLILRWPALAPSACPCRTSGGPSPP